MSERKPGIRELLPLLAGMAPRRLWLGGAALAALTVLMGMGLLGLSGWFITATALAGLVTATALLFDVFMPSAGIRLLALGRTGSRYAERLVTHDATLAVLAALRVRLFRGWAQPGAARLLQLRPARLLQRLTADVDALDSLYLRLLVPLGSALVAALMAAVVLGVMRAWMGLALGLWLLLAGMGIAWWLSRRAQRPALQRALALEALRAQAVDLVAGQTELLMASRLAAQCEKMRQADARVAKADMALNQLDARAGQWYGMASVLTLVGVLLAVGALAEAGVIGAPAAALALLVALSAMEPFAALRRGALETGRTWLAARRLAPRLQAGGQAPQRPGEPPQDMAVQLQAVTLRHAPELPVVLGPLDWQVPRMQRVAVLGASGAGKSSLLSLVAGELAPAQGQVQASLCTWLTQRTQLFQDSLRGNLSLADPQASDERLWQVLEAAGLAQDVRAMPQALDTALGESGLGLSTGQARRLALARLLLSPARCWLLDEPTEGLDAATASDVLARLAEHAQDCTVVIATHLQREARLADRLVWLEAGQWIGQVHRGEPGFEMALQRLRPD